MADSVVIRWEDQHFIVNQELVLLSMQYATTLLYREFIVKRAVVVY